MFKRVLSAVAVSFLAVSSLVPAAHAALGRTIWVVDNGGYKLQVTNDPATATGCPTTPGLLATYAGEAGLRTAVNEAVANDTIILCNNGSQTRATFDLSTLTPTGDPNARTLQATVPLTIVGQTNVTALRPMINGGNAVRPFIIAAGALDLVTITGVTIAGGVAAGSGDVCTVAGACGGAIKIASGQLLLTKSVIKDNLAGGSGAGIAVTSVANASLTVENSAFISNAAQKNGGAIFNAGNNSVTITNSTFTANAANIGGGAVVYDASGNTFANYITAIDNYGAGAAITGTSVTVRNSILAQKSHPTPVCDTSVNLGLGNLVTTAGCSGVSTYTPGSGASTSGLVTYSQLRIGRLYTPANVGVPHFRLLTGSAAIDYIPADANTLTKDQVGNSRPATAPFGLFNDAGAVEKSEVANVRQPVALLAYPTNVDLNAYDTTALVPSTFAEFASATASYSSLTPDICTTDGNGLMLLKEIGDCVVETYVPDSTVGGVTYEEFFSTTSFKVYVPHAPSIPTNMFIVTKTTSLKISFSAPVDNGGSAITKYFIQVKAKTSATGTTVECLANPCTVTGLLSDTQYSVNIVVRNRDGFTGTYPIANNIKTAATVAPTSPRFAAAKPGVRQVTIKWLPPRSVGQTPLAFYVIRIYKPSNLVVPFKEVTVPATKAFGTVKGLTARAKYVAKVFAYNSGGGSLPSTNVTFTSK